MKDGILVLLVGEPEIRTPNSGVFASQGVDLFRIQIAVVGKVVLAGQGALAGDRADSL